MEDRGPPATEQRMVLDACGVFAVYSYSCESSCASATMSVPVSVAGLYSLGVSSAVASACAV